MPAYAPVEYNYLEILAKALLIAAKKTVFSKKKFFNNAPIRRIAVALNKKSAFTAAYTENLFWINNSIWDK